MASLTIENYIKTIYVLAEVDERKPVATGAIAQRLSVAPGTVTSMLKTLRESGLADYEPYEGVALTDSGRALALRVLRRHRLIETFLVNTLKLNWDEVHDEAENLEHAVSDFLIDRIDEFLGFPETDPHGTPIPKRDGTVHKLKTIPLSELKTGATFRLKQVDEQEPEFLKYVSSIGLEIGKAGVLLERNPTAGTISIDVDGNVSTFSEDTGSKFQVIPG